MTIQEIQEKLPLVRVQIDRRIISLPIMDRNARFAKIKVGNQERVFSWETIRYSLETGVPLIA